MGRGTVYNSGLVTPEKWEQVSSKNKELLSDFLEYCRASDKSPATCHQYEQQLRIIFVYISEHCENKFFVDLKKKDLIKFTLWCQGTLKVSNSRIASLKSAISSLSNYIERVLDDEYPMFRNISNVIEPGAKEPVREKTILSEEQIQDCLDKLVENKKYQVACFMALLYASGMRKAEALQMTVDDFTEEHKVFDGKFYLTHKIRTKGKGKAGKQLQKYVICDIFEKYLNLWLEYRKKNGIVSPWLFIVYHDGEYNCAGISTANSFSETISAAVGVPCYCHNFRHAWTTMLKRKKYPESVIQKIQGWASIDMVSVYSDISDEEELGDFFTNFGKEEQ